MTLLNLILDTHFRSDLSRSNAPQVIAQAISDHNNIFFPILTDYLFNIGVFQDIFDTQATYSYRAWFCSSLPLVDYNSISVYVIVPITQRNILTGFSLTCSDLSGISSFILDIPNPIDYAGRRMAGVYDVNTEVSKLTRVIEGELFFDEGELDDMRYDLSEQVWDDLTYTRTYHPNNRLTIYRR